MTTYTDLELDRILDGFLGEGPAAAPERPIDAALAEIRVVRQRRSSRFLGGTRMSTAVRLALAAVLVLAAIAAGAAVIGSRQSVPMPIPTPSPTAPLVSPSPSAAPTAPAASTAPASPVSPVGALSAVALARVDAAIEGATTAGSPVSDAQTRLFRLTDAIREPLLAGNVSGAVTAFEPLPAAAEEVAGTLDAPSAAQLRTAVATLGGVLRAIPFPAGEMPAGTYHGQVFTPTLAVAVPAGWTRGLQDTEVLSLRKGGLTLAFDRMATAVTAEALAKALGTSDGSSLSTPPSALSLPSYSGFTGGSATGGMTLWFTEALQAFDAAPGDAVEAWVLQAGRTPLTVHLSGPPKELAAALPEVEAMLGSLVVTGSSGSTSVPSPAAATPVPSRPASGAVPVGTYWCKTLADATAAIVRDGFTVGTATVTPAGPTRVPETWLVLTQVPNPGVRREPGSPIDLVFAGPSNTASSCS